MTWEQLIGSSTALTYSQMASRSAIIFMVALLLVRISGRRAFGMRSSFDNVLSILLGAILSRAVVGASPFFPTIAGACVIVAMYRLMGYLTVKSSKFGNIIKGNARLLFSKGQVHRKNMNLSLITDKDLMEGIRREVHLESTDDIENAYLDRDGRISVTLKKNKPHSNS